MADTRGGPAACNDRCGCPNPCPGGAACRCVSSGASTGEEHSKCSCGEHCGCNPCTCPRSAVTTGVGKGYCKCGDGCTCVKCNS
ncbi:Metallothionein-like protein 4B [Turnera subulata]|uniref:Metallothionein-like protein 4B n=1 Tax=Turnera subulata TaxID=218843 RepID=A0A9Q0JLX5_9ROSI|nr:Metallothionein-like protein 4B [Turnera subulata]